MARHAPAAPRCYTVAESSSHRQAGLASREVAAREVGSLASQGSSPDPSPARPRANGT